MGDSLEVKNQIGDFVYHTFGEIRKFNSDEMYLLVKVLAMTHRWSEAVVPLAENLLDRVPMRVLDHLIRFLWSSWHDEDHKYIVFRLHLLGQRLDLGVPPRFWSEENFK